MKARCVPCLLNRVLYESKLTGKTEGQLAHIMKESLLKMIAIYNHNKSSAEIATEMHRLAYDLLKTRDPYKTLKEQSTKTVMELLPWVRKFIEKSNDTLTAALLCSIAGNAVDFGISGSAESPDELKHVFESYVRQHLYCNDVNALKSHLSGEVLYFTDNCGEIVLDKLVCEILSSYDIHLTLVCKQVPILTDAAYEDVKILGFDEVVDEILTTGRFAVGVDFCGITEKLRDRLNTASLIISKGMANYEAFSETTYAPIAHCMRVKCESIAESLEIPTGVNIIKLIDLKK